MMKQFKINTEYTRTEIRQILRKGELQSYLPQNNGVILAGCFNLDLNPEAPSKIYAGNAPKVIKKVDLLNSSRNISFPVFIKQKRNSKYYQYQGDYKCVDLIDDAKSIDAAEKRSKRQGAIYGILKLEKI